MYKTLKQLSVFAENKPGGLLSITSALEQNKISILSIMLSDSREFGILRLLTEDLESAKKVLLDANFSVTITDVLAVQLKDKIGSFNKIVKILTENDINIRYTYTVDQKDKGVFVFKVSDENLEKAGKALENAGVTLIDFNDFS